MKNENHAGWSWNPLLLLWVQFCGDNSVWRAKDKLHCCCRSLLATAPWFSARKRDNFWYDTMTSPTELILLAYHPHKQFYQKQLVDLVVNILQRVHELCQIQIKASTKNDDFRNKCYIHWLSAEQELENINKNCTIRNKSSTSNFPIFHNLIYKFLYALYLIFWYQKQYFATILLWYLYISVQTVVACECKLSSNCTFVDRHF